MNSRRQSTRRWGARKSERGNWSSRRDYAARTDRRSRGASIPTSRRARCGSLAISWSSLRSPARGLREPCSQLWTVFVETLRNAAKNACDIPSRLRSAATWRGAAAGGRAGRTVVRRVSSPRACARLWLKPSMRSAKMLFFAVFRGTFGSLSLRSVWSRPDQRLANGSGGGASGFEFLGRKVVRHFLPVHQDQIDAVRLRCVQVDDSNSSTLSLPSRQVAEPQLSQNPASKD